VAGSVGMWRFMKTHTSDVFNFDGDTMWALRHTWVIRLKPFCFDVAGGSEEGPS